MNDDVFAEWGYISMKELIDIGASPDRSWKPCTYLEAMKKIKEYKMDKWMRRR
ncbi:MAG: hypothetical protein HMLIMOIP_002309 [Candidatus Nitrosomirales archaeon]